MPDSKYLGLLREVERLRDEMKAAQGEGSRIDPLRVAIILDGMITACEGVNYGHDTTS